jgi:hypothetical protein
VAHRFDTDSRPSFAYATCCVHDAADAIIAMTEQAREVTYQTACRHLKEALRDWAEGMGYATAPRERGLRLKGDWHVRYYRSRYRGKPCFYVVHSAIEYVFVATA